MRARRLLPGLTQAGIPSALVVLACASALLLAPLRAAAQPATNRVDIISPMAPELSPYGSHAVGVRTLSVTNRSQPDIHRTRPGQAVVRTDRTLTLEVWYPATGAPADGPRGTYEALVRDGRTRVTLHGRAVREAPVEAGVFPLIIVSHGHPGSRYLMSHLSETWRARGTSSSPSTTPTACTTVSRCSPARFTTVRSTSCSC